MEEKVGLKKRKIKNCVRKIGKTISNGLNSLDRHPVIKGVLLSALAATTVQLVGEKINPKAQVVQIVPTSSSTVESEYGMVSALGENITYKSFENKVEFMAEDGNLVNIPYSDIMILSSSFSKSETNKYNTVYKLNTDAALYKKGKENTIKTYLKSGDVVIGESISEGENYINVCTDNGLTGKMSSESLEKIMNIPKKSKKDTATPIDVGDNSYVATNGEVLGIDVNTSAVDMEKFEKLLSGQIQQDPVGQIKNTKVNYVYIKIGGYYGEKEKHTPLWNENEYEEYMDKIVKMTEICRKHNVKYGFYFYSKAINNEEGLEEAKLINKKMQYFKDHGVEAPTLPLAIDVEMDTNRHGKIVDRQKSIMNDAKKIEEASSARALIFNEVLKENSDYVSMSVYTDQRATVDSGNQKILDLDTLANEIDDMNTLPIWWGSRLGIESADESSKLFNDKTTNKGKKIKIYGKQIIQDRQVEGQFLIDFNVIYEEDYKDFLKENKNKINRKTAPKVNAKQMSISNAQNSKDMVGFQAIGKTNLYNFSGKCVGYVDETTQILGRAIPDKNGRISIVTRDGRRGRVNLNSLIQIEKNNRVATNQPEEIREI